MFVELNYKKGGKGWKGGVRKEKEQRRGRRGERRGGKRKETMVGQTPFSSTSNALLLR
jgi:hypothetical protein